MHILRKYTTNMYNCVKLSVHMFRWSCTYKKYGLTDGQSD